MEKYDFVHLVRIFLPNIGGMEEIVYNLSVEQQKLGYKVLVLTSDFLRDELTTEFKNEISTIRIKSAEVKGYIFPVNYVKKIKTKVLHVHGMDPFVDFVSTFITYEEKILSPHGGFYHTNKNLIIKNLYFKYISSKIYSNSYTFSISHNDLKLMNRINNKSIYMGCGFKKREAISEGQDVIIFGRISKNKNVEKSIELALKTFRHSIIHVVGNDEIGLSKKISNTRLVFHGALEESDLTILIANSKFFICLSYYEGLGMSLLEALYAGLKCIISKIDAFILIHENLDIPFKQKVILFYEDVEINQEWVSNELSRIEKETLRNEIDSRYNWKKANAIILDTLKNTPLNV